MHTVELWEQAVAAAELLGYGVRQEWLGGQGGGDCEIAGRKWLFIDLALNVSEQLDQILQTLREDPGIYGLGLSHDLAIALGMRKSA